MAFVGWPSHSRPEIPHGGWSAHTRQSFILLVHKANPDHLDLVAIPGFEELFEGIGRLFRCGAILHPAKSDLQRLIPVVRLTQGRADDEIAIDVRVRRTGLDKERDAQQKSRQQEDPKQFISRLLLVH
jgi:hypothetical protein